MGLFRKKGRAQKRKELIDGVTEGLRDPDPVSRLLTLEKVCRLKRPPVEALPAILLALDDSSTYVQQLAAFTLGRIQEPTTVPLLAEKLLSEDELLRFISINALKKIGTPDALRAIREAEEERTERTADELADGASDHIKSTRQ